MIIYFYTSQERLFLNIDESYKAAKKGDKAAEERFFQLLTARYRLFITRKIWDKEDAEELMQESLMTVLSKYKDIEQVDNIAAWAHKVMNNKILNYFRTKSLHGKKLDEVREGIINSDSFYQETDLEKRLLKCLKKIGQTNLRHARILNLHYQGFSVQEICSKLEVSRNNLYSILSRARSMLVHCLEKGELK